MGSKDMLELLDGYLVRIVGRLVLSYGRGSYNGWPVAHILLIWWTWRGGRQL
jgi:hypothetical protein